MSEIDFPSPLKKFIIKLKDNEKKPSREESTQKESSQKESSQEKSIDFKDYVFQQIQSKINDVAEPSGCHLWLGYKEKYRLYSVACHIIYFKGGKKHYVNPQKYIYNYKKFPQATYNELIKMKNTVRNIDECRHRGICCHLDHIEETF